MAESESTQDLKKTLWSDCVDDVCTVFENSLMLSETRQAKKEESSVISEEEINEFNKIIVNEIINIIIRETGTNLHLFINGFYKLHDIIFLSECTLKGISYDHFIKLARKGHHNLIFTEKQACNGRTIVYVKLVPDFCFKYKHLTSYQSLFITITNAKLKSETLKVIDISGFDSLYFSTNEQIWTNYIAPHKELNKRNSPFLRFTTRKERADNNNKFNSVIVYDAKRLAKTGIEFYSANGIDVFTDGHNLNGKMNLYNYPNSMNLLNDSSYFIKIYKKGNITN